MTTIDLNSDVGESFGRWTLGDDAAMFRSVTSANVACGFHAGDPSVIRADLPGRRPPPASSSAPTSATATWPASAAASWTSSPSELADDVVYQIGALQALAAVGGQRGPVRQAARRPLQRDRHAHRAGAGRRRRREVRGPRACRILGLPGSEVLRLAEAAGPAGSDRSLRGPRLQPGRHPGFPHPPRSRPSRPPPKWRNMSYGWPPIPLVRTIDGSILKIRAESICVHGDSPGAVAMATAVKAALARGRHRHRRLRLSRTSSRTGRPCTAASAPTTRHRQHPHPGGTP